MMYQQTSFAEEKRVAGAVALVLTACLCSPQAAAGAPPSVLFASNLGGSQWDTARAIATDASQNIYVVGETYSSDFPGAAWSSSRQTGDAFVVKLTQTGARIYTVVLGGSGYDSARGVAVDSAGNVYVTGLTSSVDFPTTSGAFQRNSGSPGQYDAFVVKISPAGSVLYSTYLGGSSSDAGYGIAIDATGAAYVGGSTSSMNFPVTGSAPQSRLGGSLNCFVAKLDPAGATLIYATYLGGENVDSCSSIAVDGTGAAFVTGTTSSTKFPTVAALDGTLAGPSDAFVTKLSPAGDCFLFSTYLGGEGADNGNVVRVDSAGNVYVAGDTMSAAFPVSAGVLQTQLKRSYDGFVLSVANNGSTVRFATYLGGTGTDSIRDLSLAADGGIIVTGYTASMDFPVMNAVQSSYGGGAYDTFVAVLSSNGSALSFSTYLGGGGDDRAYGVSTLGTGQLVFAGQVLSGTVSAMQQLYGSTPAGQYDGFVAAITYAQSSSTQGLRFVPITPCRVADTRNPIGPFGGPAIAGGTGRDFVIPNSTCGVPPSAQAYSLNITILPQHIMGYLTLWPAGEPRPLVSLFNSPDGRTKANAAIVSAGASGAVSVFVTDTTNVVIDIVVIDINGYFTSASNLSALAFYPLTPCRVADTRTTPGPLGGPSLTGNSRRTFPVLSATGCGIPAAVQAYSLNFTLVPPGAVDFLSTWPTGQPMPLVSTLNDSTATTVANAAIVPAGNLGAADVYVTQNTNLVIDFNGYFASAGPGGLSFYPITPCRVLDTRQPPGSLPVTGELEVQMAGVCGLPATASAFVVNTTVVPPGSFVFLTLWPQGHPRPIVSTLNAVDGALTSNMAIIPSTNGWISAFLSNPTHVFFDVSGYFAPYRISLQGRVLIPSARLLYLRPPPWRYPDETQSPPPKNAELLPAVVANRSLL